MHGLLNERAKIQHEYPNSKDFFMKYDLINRCGINRCNVVMKIVCFPGLYIEQQKQAR